MKKTTLWTLVGIAGSLAIAVIAYFWAMGLMDSLNIYESPIANNPPLPGERLGEPAVERVIFILVDGLRLDTSLDEEIMPTLNHLRQIGASATMHSRAPSYSAPSYSTLFTGAWTEINSGPALNREYDDLQTWTQDNLFSAAARAGHQTAISGYNWFEKLVPQEAVNDSFYTSGEDQVADRQVVDAALTWIEEGSDQLILIHIDQVDYAGHHEGGPGGMKGWNAASSRADSLIEEIVAKADLTKDLILVCSDHGHIDAGGHGGGDSVVLQEPLVIAGAGVRPGIYPDIQMVDLAPTLAALLGTNLPASSQGNVLVGMVELPQDTLDQLPSALQAQQAALLTAYGDAIHTELAPMTVSSNIVQAYQDALERTRNARLNRERIPRFALSLLVIVCCAYALAKNYKRKAIWYTAGAFLYLLIFNLRYAVIDKKPYSISWLNSQEELILYCLTSTAIALALSWLITGGGMRLFRLKPGQAFRDALALNMTILFGASLPLLWHFSMNGSTVTWTLPNFTSAFVGLLAIIQVLLIAVIGLLLAGLTALLARIWNYMLSG